MEELLHQAEEALERRDGRLALELASRLVDQDETCAQAWLIAMKCFQLLYPIDLYDPNNELTCGRSAIAAAPPREKGPVRRQVYSFYLTKILEVLSRDAQVLADGREILGFYQRLSASDPAHAVRRAMERDNEVVAAVQRSFQYCHSLFDAIPPSALRRSAALNARVREVAVQWRKTYSYLELRFELYGCTMPPAMAEEGVRRYAHFLRTLPDREALLAAPLPFNLRSLDQLSYLEG